MIDFGPSDRVPRRLPGRVAPLLVLLCLWPADAVGQTPTAAERAGQWEFRVAASEDALWLIGLRGESSVLIRRSATTPFDRGHTANGRVVSMTAVKVGVSTVSPSVGYNISTVGSEVERMLEKTI